MGSAYQDNEKKNKEQQKWYAGDTPNSREILNRVFEIGAQDAQKGYEMYNEYLRFQQDATSPIYNPYTRATNKAVSNLSAYGIDTRKIDDNFYKQNNFLLNYLIYNGTTNTPTKPGKNASTQQKAAYEYYQIWKDEEQTKKAETEWQALQQELNYWAQRSDLNYSDDEIIDRIDWKKYPTLAAMDNDKKFTPTSLNRAIGYSSDNMYGTLWAARNGGGTGSYMNNAIASVTGQGNQWQYDEKKAKARTEDRYAAGMTLDDEGMYFGMLYFPEDWLEKNYDKYVTNGDEESRKKYNAVYKAEKDTKAAEEQLKNLNDQIKKWVGKDYSAEKIKSKLTELLESSDYNMLAQMDESTKSGGDLVKLTRAVDFNLNRILAGIDDKVKARTIQNYFNTAVSFVDGYVPNEIKTIIGNVSSTSKKLFNQWLDEAKKRAEETGSTNVVISAPGSEAPDEGTDVTAPGSEPSAPAAGNPSAGTAPLQDYDISTENYGITIQDENKIIDMMKFYQDKDYRDQVMNDPAYRENYDGVNGEGAFNRDIGKLRGYVDGMSGVIQQDQKFKDTVANLEGSLRENEEVRFIASSGTSDTTFSSQQEKKANPPADFSAENTQKVNKGFYSAVMPIFTDIFNYENTADRLNKNRAMEAELTKRLGEKAVAADTPTNNFTVEMDGNRYLVDNTNSTPVVMNLDTGDILTGKKLTAFFDSDAYKGAKDSNHYRNLKISLAKNQQFTDEENAYLDRLRDIKIQIENDENDIELGRDQYEQNAKAYREAEELWLTHYDNLIATGQSTDKMDKAYIVMNALQGFTQYDPTDWTTWNEEEKRIEAYNPMYDYANRIAKGEDRKTVLEDAKKEFDDISEQIKDYKWLNNYIEENDLDIPDNVQTNINRRIAKLERDMKAYEYFNIQFSDDFEELAQAGFEINEATITANPYLEPSLLYYDADGKEDFLTEEEKKTYYYLKALDEQDGTEKAKEYAKYMSDNTYGVATTRQALAMQKTGEDLTSSGWFGFLLANTFAIGLSPYNAITSLVYQAEHLFSGEEFNPYATELNTMHFRSATREQSAKELEKTAKAWANGDEKLEKVLNTVLQGGYEIVTNRADSAMNGLVFGNIFGDVGNAMLEEFLGAAPMGIAAGTEAIAKAKERGATDTQACVVGAVNFFAETVTEAVSLSNMKDAFLGAMDDGETMKAFLVKWLTENGISEAFGESLNNIIEGTADTLVMRELSEHQSLVDQYRKLGYANPEEMALKDEISGIIHTAIISYLSPGLDVFSHAAGRLAHYREATKKLQKRGYGEASIRTVRQEEHAAAAEGREVNWENIRNAGKTKTQTTSNTEKKSGSAKPAAPAISEEGATTKQTVNEGRMDDVAARKTAPDQEKTQAQTPEQVAETRFITDFEMLEEAKGDESSIVKTETVAAVLDDGNTEDSADEARAAAAWLDVVTGKDTDTAAEVQKLVKGAKDGNVNRELLNQGIKYAALGGADSECRRVMQSSEYKNADMQTRARMIADAAKVDAQNQRVAETVQKNVHEDRVAREEAKILAGEAGEKVNTAAETVKQRRAEAQKRHTELATQQNVANLAYEQAAQATNAVAEAAGQGQDAMADALNEQSRANQNASKESIVTQEYEQSAKNADEAVETAKSDLDKAQQDTMNEVRPMAEEAVAQQDAKRAEAAEQQRIAEEQAKAEAEALQAEEDERTGKAAEDRRDAMIEQILDMEGLQDADERDARRKELTDRAETVKIRLQDLKQPVNTVDGLLAVNAFARKLGVKIVFDDLGPIGKDGSGIRGEYNKGVIYLNKNMLNKNSYFVGQALVEAALHEITHFLKNAKIYNTYRNVVMSSVFGDTSGGDAMQMYNSNAAYKAKVDAIMVERAAAGDKNFTGDDIAKKINEADNEIVADFARMNLANKDNVQRFMDAGLGGRMRNALHNVNQALKNYLPGLDQKARQTAEYLRKAERAFQKAMNQAAKMVVHPDAQQMSIAQVAQATGMRFDAKTLTLYDQDGNVIDGVKRKLQPKDVEKTPVGFLIRSGLSLFDGQNSEQAKTESGYIDPTSTAGKALDMMTGLMNMIARYKDSDLVWEIGASTLSSTFGAMKENSDTQYKTTVDFGTICAKTQAIVDVMSQVMLDKIDPKTGMLKEGMKPGLTRTDIMKVYDATHHANLSVPCPVCYVFSRWMGVPSLLGQMSQFQKDHVVTTKNDKGESVIDWDATQKHVDEYLFGTEPGKEGMLVKYKDKKAINDKKTSLQTKLKNLEEKRNALETRLYDKSLTAEQKENINNQIKDLLGQMTDVEDELGEVRAFNWVTQALCVDDGKYKVDKKNFRITPDSVLFDLNKTSEFAEYSKNWTYRTTRGAGMGKAIMPYSGETIGDILKGANKGKRQSALRNPWLNYIEGGKNTSAARQLSDARTRAKQQNLLGGQRLQSTSDFRPEWGLDYVMSFLELQAANSKVQMYTKVAEAVDFFASVGADVNLSIMGKNTGWREATQEEIDAMTDEQKKQAELNGKYYVLEFSDVTGMKYKGDASKGEMGAVDYKNKYDNVQMILVGMNDTHIRLAMKNSDIDFIIPWHSSGNSKEVLSNLISAVGEQLNTSVDYTKTQSDMKKGEKKSYYDEDGNKIEYSAPGEQTEGEKQLWDLRMRILTGKANNTVAKGGFTEEERSLVYKDKWLRQLYDRFYVKGVDDNCYGVKLSSKQAGQIFPYEYWATGLVFDEETGTYSHDPNQKGATKDTADENGKRFKEYCERMGIIPRFSQFSEDTGYWKLLIDRPMYNNDGTYREQQTINVTNARIGQLNESGKLDKSTTDLPTQARAAYAPKDVRNPMYKEYKQREENAVRASEEALGIPRTYEQDVAIEDAKSIQDEQYSDGVNPQLSVYGEQTEADMALMEAEDAEDALADQSAGTNEQLSFGGDLTEADMALARTDQALIDAGVLTEEELAQFNALSTQTGEGSRQRQFGHKTAQESDALHDDVKEYLYMHSDYTPDTNQAQINRAADWVRSMANENDPNGYHAAIDEVTSENFDYRSADGQARMLTVMAMAAQQGDHAAEQRIANAYNGQGTDIAQALQARKIFRLMTPVGRRMTLQQEVARINQQYANEGRSDIQVRLSDLTLKAAEMAETEEDFAKVQKAANKELAEQMPANWKDKLRTWRMLSMLANPRTHIRNIVGNWIFVPTVGIKNAIGAGLESKFIKNGERTKAIRYTEDAKAFAKKDVQAMKDTLTGEAKYSPESKLQQEQKAFGQGNGILSRTIGRGVQAIADANSWALEAEDWVFLNKHYQNAMASYMTANNLTSEQMTGKTLEKARAYAVQEAQKATYRDANAVSSLLNKASREGGIKGFLVDAILPFKKTPANILRRGIEYSPIGLIKSFATAKRSLDLYQSWVNNGMKGDAPKGAKSMTQVLDGIASGITGTGIAALGALGYMLGAVKLGFGGAPDDELEKENGSQEYSIELFGYSFTIDWAAPVCMPFFTGAALYKEFSEAAGDIKNLGDVTSVMGRVINGLGSISEPVFNLSMLDGVSSLLQSSSYSNTNSVPVFELLQNIGANYVGSFAPSFVGAVARTVDRTTRKSYVESGDPLRIWKQKMEQTQNKIPYLSMYNIPYRDVWGNTNESSVLEAVLENFILPGYVNKLKDDKKIDELWRIFDETGETSVIPKTAAKKVGGASLTDQEYDRYVVTRGQTANNLLNELVNRDEFITLTPTDVSEGNPEAQVKLISKVWEYANAVARKELDPNYKMDSWIAEAQKKGNVIDAIFNKEEAKAKSDAADQAFKEMFASINGNDADGITTSLEALRRAGKTNKQIRDKLMRQYGNVYKQAYLDGDIDTMDDIEDALMLLDLEESSFKSSTFKTWKKNANKKANEDEDEE